MNSGKQKKNKIRDQRELKRNADLSNHSPDENSYHIPNEWSYPVLWGQYQELAYRLKVQDPIQFQIDDRPYHLDLLWKISLGIKTRDTASIELSVRFVAAQVYFSFSGYTRSQMARRLKSVDLTANQKEILRKGIYHILESMIFGPEIKELISLIRKIGFGKWEKQYLSLAGRFYAESLFRKV